MTDAQASLVPPSRSCGLDEVLLAQAGANEELEGFAIMEPMQCRAARGLLQWTQNELSTKSGISVTTIRHFETGVTKANPATRIVLRQTLEKAGVEFLDTDRAGVQMKRKQKK
jgi:DNA-binding XRE family transcriptional regulator